MLCNLQGGSQIQYPKESPRMGIEKTVIHWILKKLWDSCFYQPLSYLDGQSQLRHSNSQMYIT